MHKREAWCIFKFIDGQFYAWSSGRKAVIRTVINIRTMLRLVGDNRINQTRTQAQGLHSFQPR